MLALPKNRRFESVANHRVLGLFDKEETIKTMSNLYTQQQRRELLQSFRQTPIAQTMGPAQREQIERQILGGQLDQQIQEYLARNPQHQPPTQQQQQPADARGFAGDAFSGFTFNTPFGPIQIPGMAPVTTMQPPAFDGLPQMPSMFSPSGIPQAGTIQPLQTPFGSQAMPQIHQQSIQVPGGHANQHNVSFSGERDGAKFSCSSSSTSFSSTTGSMSAGAPPPQQIFPALPGFQQPAALEAPTRGTSGVVEESLPTPAPPGPRPAQPATPTAVPRCLLQPPRATHLTPHNARLHNAFTETLNENTYFSRPVGMPDRAVHQTEMQRRGKCGSACPACAGDATKPHDWQIELSKEILEDE